MRYLATSFSIVLGAWRFRVSFDIEDDPEIRTLAMQQVAHAHERGRRTATAPIT